SPIGYFIPYRKIMINTQTKTGQYYNRNNRHSLPIRIVSPYQDQFKQISKDHYPQHNDTSQNYKIIGNHSIGLLWVFGGSVTKEKRFYPNSKSRCKQGHKHRQPVTG